MNHNDIMAAWLAWTHRSEQEAAEHDPETAQWAREQYRRGAELLQQYTIWSSARFPHGADPDNARLEQFKAKHKIVEWTETSAGYIGTAEQRCYIGLALR